LETPGNVFSASSSDEYSATSERFQTGLIGYTCPYIPVEILSATGFRPYCLLHGDYDLMQHGTQYARVDACPLVRANIAYIIENKSKFAALVGTTGCDMSRRMFDILGEHTRIPCYLMHQPRTYNQKIHNDEIDWLIDSLSHLSKRNIMDALTHEIDKWEAARNVFRKYDRARYGEPSTVSSSDFQKVATHYYKGELDAISEISENLSNKPRVYLVGSEVSYESREFLELLEVDLRIVGDFVCGISTFLNISIAERTLSGIKNAYHNQPPCIYRRPNKAFYEHTVKQIAERKSIGVIAFTLDYCDAYEFELKKMEATFGLPLLRIRSDYSFQKISQLKTRIAAFGEMLCS